MLASGPVLMNNRDFRRQRLLLVVEQPLADAVTAVEA